MIKPVFLRARSALVFYNEILWYEKQRQGLGAEFELCVDAAIDSIKRHNNIGSVISRSVRRVIVKRFPFGIYYRNHKDHIEIIGIRHFKLKPLYIKK